jgi:predicted nuclease of predicted toxin-antitoxin system
VLESEGFQVSKVSEEDLTAAKDRKIAEYCAKNSFAVLTHDDDFLSLSQTVELDFTVIYIPQRINFKKMKQRIKKLQKEKLRGSSIVYL